MILVAGYCRVSTDRGDQNNSFESQKRYFREYIESHPDWSLYEIYADEGITGTSTKKRTQFNRMIRDAREGKFNLIVTKEVSRFSRNILDTIGYTRQLKALGVGVRFLNDGIDTLEPDAELRLSIMASIAQEESRRTSSRVVWGQTRQMERGVVFGPSMLGYDVKNGTLSINQEGANIVREIFHKYALEQMSTSDIARYLTDQGFQTYQGNSQWKPNTIIKILKNEKYAGDLIQKKNYTPDYLTHEKKSNHGQVPMVIIKNHHDPIISREIWNKAQLRLSKNNKHQKGRGAHSSLHTLSGKIICGECGHCFVGRYKYFKDGSKIRRWSCGTHGCKVGKLLRDDDALEMVKIALKNLPTKTDDLIFDMASKIQTTLKAPSEIRRKLVSELKRIELKKEAMLDSFFGGETSNDEMVRMKKKYDTGIAKLEHQIHDLNDKNMDDIDLPSTLRSILTGEGEREVFIKTILKSITVFRDRHMELRFKGSNFVFWFEES